MVVDFFAILGEDPQSALGRSWATILKQRAAFEKIQSKCILSLKAVDWPAKVSSLDRIKCPACGSSLVGQLDLENEDHEYLEGKCYQCGEQFGHETASELVAQASYGISAYEIAKEGLQPPVTDCPECGVAAYVESPEGVSVCFCCTESVAGECARCSNEINAYDYDPDHPDLCSYCGYMLDKIMRE